MFCRYCGKPLMDDAVFCTFCGKQLGEKQEEAVVFNAPFETDPEFVWNLHEFPKPKPTEDVVYPWGEPSDELESASLEPELPTSAAETLHGKPSNHAEETGAVPTASTKANMEENHVENVNPVDEKEPEISLPPNPEIRTQSNPEIGHQPNPEEQPKQRTQINLEETLFIENDQEQGQKIDKFYTFNKKNEEFQKLLDKEYEKIQKKNEPAKPNPEPDQTTKSNLTAKPNPEPEQTTKSNLSAKPNPVTKLQPESKPNPTEEVNLSAKEQSPKQTGFTTEETHKPNMPPDQDRELARLDISTESEDEETLILDNETLLKKFDTREFEKDLIESALARSGAKVTLVNIESEDTQQKPPKLETATGEETCPLMENSGEEQEQELEAIAGDLEESEDVLAHMSQTKQDAFKALEALWAEQDGEDATQNKEKVSNEADAGQESTQQLTKGRDVSGTKGLAGKIILCIIIALLTFEIAILGIRALAPNSGAATLINEKLRFAVSWIDALNSTEPEDQGEDQEEPQEVETLEDSEVPQPEPEPNPEPHEDKALLIESQLGNNENILRIEANDLLTYNGQKDYKVKDINNSKPIDNNIWLDESGLSRYYDEAVVAAIIKFNSQWVDYVNEGDQAILSIVKTGNMAEKNIRNFPKVKAMDKTFDLLQIGEIRKGENGFYVWAHEEMTDVENGKTTKQEKNWIYHLEPTGDQMLIVGYYPF